MNLSPSDFEAFHEAVHGTVPFAWQARLLETIVAEKQWPRVLDLPTGTGKTTCIDIAVFALALDASQPIAKRWCPRRIAMVVDRRIVVDQAADRGRRLLRALLSPEPGTAVHAVADALAQFSDGPPLAVFTLRGGIPKDDGWIRTPDQPMVIASTVDQLGSRLLMSGYGVRGTMRPVHAGLAANDILMLLDEVHLSEPFRQTLERLAGLRERFATSGLPRRFHVAFLSATPGTTKTPFQLTGADLDAGSALGARLHARKSVRIVKVAGRAALAERIVSETLGLLERHTVVAAVVNRIDSALSVFGSLAKAGQDALLLTGRMRPLDREDQLARYRSRIAADSRVRSAGESKLVVVGTQCIEAGADFDFDAMVAESASFDALRQRFGRVDRLGSYKDGSGVGRAEGIVVHDKDEPDDPLYGDRIAATVKWLEGRVDKNARTVDFGSLALLDAPAELLARKPNAPALLPAYLDLWSQTSPEPLAIPEVSLFLHGPQSGPPDVQVVWRADLRRADLDLGSDGEEATSLVARIAAVPPSSLEAVSLPPLTVRRWLLSGTSSLAGIGDVEIGADDEGETDEGGGRKALRWRGDASEIVGASGVRPGDTLVVPSDYGGLDPVSRCFDPRVVQDVPDLAERASLLGRGCPALRLHPRVLENLGLALNLEDVAVAREELKAVAPSLDGWQKRWAEWLGEGRKVVSVPSLDASTPGWSVLGARRVEADRLMKALGPGASERSSIEDGAVSTTDEEDSAYLGTEVTLEVHSRDVEARAREYARRLGFSEALANDLSLAAWLHDVGKVDRRFQRMLRGGSEIAYYRDENRILAKSAMPSNGRAARQRAQALSGYPPGNRHEVQSVAMLEAAREQVSAKAHDFDLVMHLVASHHGHCRPFAPAIDDARPVTTELASHASEIFGTVAFPPTSSAHALHRLDGPVADRFWSLVAKYGWLELCWLEAVLRLADHRASEEEAARGESPL